jgi:DNA-3-methyladenine glycosylase II
MEPTGTIDLPAVVPFDLAKTVAALRRRPNALTDDMCDGEYRRVLTLGGRERVLGVRQIAPDRVRVRGLDGAPVDAESNEAAAIIQRMLGLDVDLAPLAARLEGDPLLSGLLRRLAGMKPPRYPALWITFASIVPYQQVSLESGVAVTNRLITALGTRHGVAGQVAYGFPSAATFLRAEPEVLRVTGLSAAKIRALRAIAERIEAGELTEEEIAPLGDEAAIARLTALPGIGPWSAQIVLLRGFRRLTVFPQGDAGAIRNLRVLYDLPQEEVARKGEALLRLMGPWRGYLYFLLLGSNLLARGLVEPAEE